MPIGESLDVRKSGEEWRGVVYPRDKWVISEIPDLTSGEPGRVRRVYITVFCLVWDWDIPVIAFDPRFGGCRCFRENPGGSDYPSLVREYLPYAGRSCYVNSDIAWRRSLGTGPSGFRRVGSGDYRSG